MKKFLASCLLSISSVSYSQVFTVNKTVPCGQLKSIIEEVSGEKFNEVPFWNGADDKTKYLITVNRQTKGWTIIQYNDQGIACVIGAGDRATLIFPNTKDM